MNHRNDPPSLRLVIIAPSSSHSLAAYAPDLTFADLRALRSSARRNQRHGKHPEAAQQGPARTSSRLDATAAAHATPAPAPFRSTAGVTLLSSESPPR